MPAASLRHLGQLTHSSQSQRSLVPVSCHSPVGSTIAWATSSKPRQVSTLFPVPGGPALQPQGQRICRQDERHEAGPGTYVRNGFIHSSLAGFVNIKDGEDGKNSVTVATEVEQSVVPTIGSLVTAQVTSVNPRFCKCVILNVDGSTLREPFRGIIRKEDVKATEKDKVEMYKSFRPADVVLAKVLTLGDSHSYLLTTAENELGVVIATSEAGGTLVPISWNEMQCPKTFAKEFRKVARVHKRHLDVDKT